MAKGGPLERNFGLDFIRATAILLVVFSHGAHFMQSQFAAMGLNSRVLEVIIWVTGVVGVELFYCLSGFLIGGLLLQIENRSLSGVSVSIFLVRRWMRTLPLYFIVLAVLYFNVALDNSERQRVWSYLLLSQNLVTPMPQGNWFGPSWSLVIEEWSYFLLPLLALSFKPARHPTLIAATLLICCGFVARLSMLDIDSPWDSVFRKMFLMRLDAIAYGVVLSWLFARSGDSLFFYRSRGLALLAGIGVTASIIILANRAGLESTFGRVLALPAFSISMCALMPTIMGLTWRFGWLAVAVREIAVVSYAAYLVHWPCRFLFSNYEGSWRFPAYLATTFMVSFALSYLVEQPIMRIRPRQTSCR